MDFNEIKNTWNDSFKETEHLNRTQLEEILKIKSRSNTALAKIKSSFKLELITGLAMYIFIISALMIFIDFPEAAIFFVLITLLMGLPLYFYYKTYKKIKDTAYTDSTLKQSLIKTTDDIKNFVMIGKGNFLKFIMIPLATLTGMIIGLYIGTGENNFLEIITSLSIKTIVKMIVLLIVFSGVLIPFSKYWFKRKFKQHYDELTDCLKEYEETENTKS